MKLLHRLVSSENTAAPRRQASEIPNRGSPLKPSPLGQRQLGRLRPQHGSRSQIRSSSGRARTLVAGGEFFLELIDHDVQVGPPPRGDPGQRTATPPSRQFELASNKAARPGVDPMRIQDSTLPVRHCFLLGQRNEQVLNWTSDSYCSTETGKRRVIEAIEVSGNETTSPGSENARDSKRLTISRETNKRQTTSVPHDYHQHNSHHNSFIPLLLNFSHKLEAANCPSDPGSAYR